MGLDTLADDLASIGGRVMEMDYDEAQAEFQDLKSGLSDKPVKSLEFAKKADEAIDLFTDSANADLNFGVKRGNEMIAQNIKGMAKDLGNTFKIIQKMVDSDETEGAVGSGNSSPMKGFRPEVLETIKSMESISDKLEEIKDEIDDEKTNDIISEIQGEIEFCTDDSADHDGYTKPHKVNSSIESISKLIKSMSERTKEVNKGVPAEPKVPPQKEMQKDLEDMVTDGIIDVEFDGSEINMSKEYEPSQEREAERDAEAIRDYLKKKGVKMKKDDIEIEKDEDYIQITVNKNINETFTQRILEQMKKLKKVDVSPEHDAVERKEKTEDADYLKPRLNPSQIANIKKTWQDKKPGDVTPAVKKMIKDMDIPSQLAIKHANIKFLSKLVEDLGKEDEPKVKQIIKKLKGASQAHAGQAKDLEKVMKTEADLTKSQIKMVHKKADELPKKDFKSRYGKDGDSVRYAVATNIIKKKQGKGEMKTDNKDHPAKNVYEQIKGLKNKAEKSGMPYSILKKVYDRGMAAWRGGHRPGTTQQQWAFARVNSFVTKSSGTWGGADKDLAAKVRGSK